MNFVLDDGGRADAGFKGLAGDCVTRAIAIATQRPYDEVYQELAIGNGTQRRSKHSLTNSGKKTARNGINVRRKWFKEYMLAHGFEWTPTMQIGSGCQVHLRDGELPMVGRLIVCVSKHYVALIDGVLHDTHDPSRSGTRCVYGYWTLQSGEVK